MPNVFIRGPWFHVLKLDCLHLLFKHLILQIPCTQRGVQIFLYWQ